MRLVWESKMKVKEVQQGDGDGGSNRVFCVAENTAYLHYKQSSPNTVQGDGIVQGGRVQSLRTLKREVYI